MKKIIVCCDGTSNSAYESPVNSPRTNVSRISHAVQTSNTKHIQMLLYQNGVGTAPGSYRLLNQALGTGIRDKIKEIYNLICHNYEPGDQIILIGFSRGAFAVRCIADLINTMGLLTRLGLRHLHAAFSCWWTGGTRKAFEGLPGFPAEDRDKVFYNNWHPECSTCPPLIEACALWDTVDSVFRNTLLGEGGPPERISDGEVILGAKKVFHALSLHEQRFYFKPVRAVPLDSKLLARNTSYKECPNHPNQGIGSGVESNALFPRFDQHLEQCWFSGYHADIGGGRPVDVLAFLPLIWMRAKLSKDNLVEFDADLWKEGALSHASEMLKSIRIEKASKAKEDAEVEEATVIDGAVPESAQAILRRKITFDVPSSTTRIWRVADIIKLTRDRYPGLITGATETESIHWSVFYHMYPYGIQGDPEHPSTIPQCSWLKEARPSDTRGGEPRFWEPCNDTAKWRRVQESHIQPGSIELELITGWMNKVIRDSVKAKPGAEGLEESLTTRFTALFNIYNLNFKD